MRFTNPYVSLIENFTSELLDEIPEQWKPAASSKLSELSKSIIPTEGFVGFAGLKEATMANFTSDVRQFVEVPYLGSTTDASRKISMTFARLNRDRRRHFVGWLINPVEHFALLVDNRSELDCSPKLEARLAELEALRYQTWASNGRSLSPYLKLSSKIVESKEYRRLFGVDHLARARVANDQLPLALPPSRNVIRGQYLRRNPLQEESDELSEILSYVEVPSKSAKKVASATADFFDSVEDNSFAELKASAVGECAELVLSAGHVSSQSREARLVRSAVARFERKLESLQAGLNSYSAAANKHFSVLERVMRPWSDTIKINVLNVIGESVALANTPKGLQHYLDKFEYMLCVAGLESFLASTSGNEELYRLTARLEATAMIDSAI